MGKKREKYPNNHAQPICAHIQNNQFEFKCGIFSALRVCAVFIFGIQFVFIVFVYKSTANSTYTIEFGIHCWFAFGNSLNANINLYHKRKHMEISLFYHFALLCVLTYSIKCSRVRIFRTQPSQKQPTNP